MTRAGESRHVVVSLGSNEQREQHLLEAFDALDAHFSDLCFSPIYESFSPLAQAHESSLPAYYNVVVSFYSDLPLDAIHSLLKQIESNCGRDRALDTVAMDIDLLLWGDYVGEGVNGALPREDILRFAYTLRPLADLLPHSTHPCNGKSYSELWMEFCREADNNNSLTPVDFVWREQVISVSAPCLII